MRPPEDIDQLNARGWAAVERNLETAASELALVTHWFVTPEDDSVHSDQHLGSDERTLTFLRVVVPTLAQQLSASIVSVAVPWNLDGGAPLMALVSAVGGEVPRIEARALIRSNRSPGPPWWRLGEDLVVVPVELADVAAGLRI
jgi:hypothetical protein